MSKRTFLFISWILPLYFLIFTLLVLTGFNSAAELWAPAGMYGCFILLFYNYIKSDFKPFWLMTGLTCLLWGIADTLSLVFTIVLKTLPVDVGIVQFAYLASNFTVVSTILIYFFRYLKRWNTLQLLVDISAALLVQISFVGLLFFNNQVKSLLDFSPENIMVLLCILCDGITLSGVFILYSANTFKRMDNALKLVFLGLVIYAGTDFYFLYLQFNNIASSLLTLEIFYVGALTMLSFGGLLRLYRPAVAKEQVPSQLPDNIGSGRMRLLLGLSAALVFIKGFVLSQVIYVSLIVTLHQVISGFIRDGLQKEVLLQKEKHMNERLEQIVHERTLQLQKVNRELLYLSSHDTVTGLYNRGYFLKQLEQYISEAAVGVSLHLFFMDLDRFKSINDSYGHDKGDAVLKEIARRLERWVRESMLPARLGGDEFVIAIKEACSKEKLHSYASEIRSLCSEAIPIPPYTFSVDVSIGISSFPADASDRSTLMKNADKAMYHAKYACDDGIAFYDNRIELSE